MSITYAFPLTLTCFAIVAGAFLIWMLYTKPGKKWLENL